MEKNNELISKFMGYEKVTVNYFGTKRGKEKETKWQIDNEEWMEKVGLTDIGDYIVNVKEDEFIEWEDVAYHTSWEWLMPVVSKIRDLNCVITIRFNRKMNTTTTQINGFMDGWTTDIECTDVGIDSTYKAIVTFINWYNDKS